MDKKFRKLKNDNENLSAVWMQCFSNQQDSSKGRKEMIVKNANLLQVATLLPETKGNNEQYKYLE